MKNIIFIDVDGTLTTQKGDVPNSAKEAISKTQRKGSLVFLCTGRSMAEITPELMAMNFDGIIAAGGAYIQKGETVLKHKTMSTQDVEWIMNYLDNRKVGYYLESNEGLYPNEYCIDKILKSVERLITHKPELFLDQDKPEPQWFIDILKETEGEMIPKSNINKVSFVSISHPYEETYNEFKDKFTVYPSTVFEFGEQSGEIGLKDIDKQTAIDQLMSTMDQGYKTYAFGDGLNDISMFNAVDYGVAMDNAHSKLKEIANEITGRAEEDGILNSFILNNLI